MEQKTEESQAVDERALFEQHFIDNASDKEGAKLLLSFRNENGKYEAPWLNDQLWGWQARAALNAQQAPTEAAQGEDSARLECAHVNGRTASWDWITCDDCGAIHTDSNDREWGIAKNMWFKSVSEAKFYKANGRYPDRARASAETGGVKP